MRNQVILEKLRRNRSYVLILAFIASALVHRHAPPDATSMAFVAVAMYLVFEVGLLVASRAIKR